MPVPLATALGSELFKVLVDQHEEDQQVPAVVKEERGRQRVEISGIRKGSKGNPISLDDSDDEDRMDNWMKMC